MFEKIQENESSPLSVNTSGKQVAIVIGTLETGGAERMALNLLRQLLSIGFNVRLYCLGSDINMPMPGSEQEQKTIRQAIVSLGKGTARQSTLTKAMAFPLLHWRLEQELKRSDVGLVISFMERANILNLLGSRRIPRVISIRNHLAKILSAKSFLKRTLVVLGYRLLLTRASNINFNASEAAENFRSLYPGLKVPVSVIYNFFDSDVAELSRVSPGEHAEKLLSGRSILTSGRLIPVKGHASLIRAFSKVAEQLADTKLLILGEGPLKDELQKTDQ